MKCKTIKSTSYTQSSTNFIINTGFTDSCARNCRDYGLILCTNLPAITAILPVLVQFNGANIPLLDCIGNRVMSGQLCTRKCYPMLFGNNPNHLSIRCKICPSVSSSVAMVTNTIKDSEEVVENV